MLLDPLKRQIDYLRVSITDKCNLKCIYCVPEKGLRYFKESDILTSDEITRFVRIACKYGIRKVRLTGGEPLLRNDIISLVLKIKGTGIGNLSMTTNGLLLSQMAGSLKNAGLNRVNISLDTLNALKYKTMTRGGDIHRVWEAIESAQSEGLSPIKINVVPIREVNDEEIADFASLTFDNDYHIRFIEFMPISRNKWAKRAYVPKNELMKKISALGTLIPFEFRGRGPSRNYRIEGAKGIIGFISPVSECFCEFCNRLRLTADGRIKPCLLSDVEIDIKTPIRDGISDEGLEELFSYAISVKPSGHYLKEGKVPSLVSMSKIGG